MFNMGQKMNWIQRLTIAAGLLAGTSFGLHASADEVGIPLHGFADANLATTGSFAPDDQRLMGANFGTLDLYLTPELGHDVKALFEVVWETDANTGSMGTDVERAQLGYTINDNNSVWAGRFHTPYGVWNTSYHHGKQLMPTINRPRFLDFEDSGGVLPAHSTGLWWHGGTPVGGNKINYDAFVANGSRIVPNSANTGGISEFNVLKMDHPNAEVGMNLGYQFKTGKLDGLLVGVHAYQTTVNAYVWNGTAIATGQAYMQDVNGGQPNAQISQTMGGAYVYYENDNLTLDAEFYGLSDTNRAPGKSDGHPANMDFVQVDYAVHGNWRPFVMFEQAALDGADPYFQNLIDAASYNRTSIGVRYDISPEACVKAGWAGTNQYSTPGMTMYNTNLNGNLVGTGQGYYDKWDVQYAIRF